MNEPVASRFSTRLVLWSGIIMKPVNQFSLAFFLTLTSTTNYFPTHFSSIVEPYSFLPRSYYCANNKLKLKLKYPSKY